MSRELVVYFSITGVTEGVALNLAESIGADLHEIRPKVSLPGEAAAENSQEKPQVTFEHLNIEGYDTIYVGLPIWWYAAPTVIHDFLSDYDLRGKTLIPFATSGGGGVDKIRPRLLESCPGADLREATILTESWSNEELRAWADSFRK